MPDPSAERPKNPEVETENQAGGGDGPPRPATEPAGAQGSSDSAKTATDPATGRAKPAP